MSYTFCKVKWHIKKTHCVEDRYFSSFISFRDDDLEEVISGAHGDSSSQCKSLGSLRLAPLRHWALWPWVTASTAPEHLLLVLTLMRGGMLPVKAVSSTSCSELKVVRQFRLEFTLILCGQCVYILFLQEPLTFSPTLTLCFEELIFNFYITLRFYTN